MSSEAKKEVETFLLEGQKIAAIRYLTETCGFTSQESTLLVDALEKDLRRQPDNTGASPRNPRGTERSGTRAATGSDSRTPEIIVYVFAGIGLLFIGVAALLYYQQSGLIRKSDPAKGKVVRLRTGNGSGSAPVVEYEWRGNKYTYTSATYSSPPAYTIGELVPIYVNRDDPGDIIIDTFLDRYFLITIFGGMGFLFVAIGYGVMGALKKTSGLPS
ncbi:MAG TPA: DUF3592 domain-containing protein [Chryseosolibacter sp.]